jgi:hypothetical protein
MHLKFLSHQMGIDTTKVSQFSFLGLKQGIKKVKLLQVIGCIDRSRPYKNIRYLKEYKSVKEITIPTAYIIPKRFGILWIY